MLINVGYELIYECPKPTPMLLMLNIHSSRIADIISGDHLITSPPVTLRPYHDTFGNWCGRIVAPAGQIVLTSDAVVRDSGEPDPIYSQAEQHPVEDLPDDTLVYLLGSRYCETDRLSDAAWNLFEKVPPGWQRVQAICDFVHHRIKFGYEHARPTKTAFEAFEEGYGVCRDYAHLAVALCRCLNIPARYCTGYIGDIGMPPPYGPMDFCAWFEVYIGNAWRVFDARNNVPRIGRILMARGRDAADVALSTTFGPNLLTGFKVWVNEVPESAPAGPS